MDANHHETDDSTDIDPSESRAADLVDQYEGALSNDPDPELYGTRLIDGKVQLVSPSPGTVHQLSVGEFEAAVDAGEWTPATWDDEAGRMVEYPEEPAQEEA